MSSLFTRSDPSVSMWSWEGCTCLCCFCFVRCCHIRKLSINRSTALETLSQITTPVSQDWHRLLTFSAWFLLTSYIVTVPLHRHALDRSHCQVFQLLFSEKRLVDWLFPSLKFSPNVFFTCFCLQRQICKSALVHKRNRICSGSNSTLGLFVAYHRNYVVLGGLLHN